MNTRRKLENLKFAFPVNYDIDFFSLDVRMEPIFSAISYMLELMALAGIVSQ
jgi:hypothetical protein